jgi:proteasome lid subunit RPN8/RPN11
MLRTRDAVLRISPYAWAKMLYMRDNASGEVGGYGIGQADDPLAIDDFCLIKQQCSSVTVAFDDEAVSRYFVEQVQAGRQPYQFARVWVHTHPGFSPTPSSVDEDTFARLFDKSDWGIMLVIGGNKPRVETHCRLWIGGQIRASVVLQVVIDYNMLFAGSDRQTWTQELRTLVSEDPFGAFCGATRMDDFSCAGKPPAKTADGDRHTDVSEQLEERLEAALVRRIDAERAMDDANDRGDVSGYNEATEAWEAAEEQITLYEEYLRGYY